MTQPEGRPPSIRPDARCNRVDYCRTRQVDIRCHDDAVADAPAFRIWPPVALGVPLLAGVIITARAASRTAVLPGGATRTVLDRGPFRLSRNPLYLGLIVLDASLGMLWPSAWALVLLPVGIGLLLWGAIAPEERYLSAKFGAEYDDYRRRVRRWL